MKRCTKISVFPVFVWLCVLVLPGGYAGAQNRKHLDDGKYTLTPTDPAGPSREIEVQPGQEQTHPHRFFDNVSGHDREYSENKEEKEYECPVGDYYVFFDDGTYEYWDQNGNLAEKGRWVKQVNPV